MRVRKDRSPVWTQNAPQKKKPEIKKKYNRTVNVFSGISFVCVTIEKALQNGRQHTNTCDMPQSTAAVEEKTIHPAYRSDICVRAISFVSRTPCRFPIRLFYGLHRTDRHDSSAIVHRYHYSLFKARSLGYAERGLSQRSMLLYGLVTPHKA